MRIIPVLIIFLFLSAVSFALAPRTILKPDSVSFSSEQEKISWIVSNLNQIRGMVEDCFTFFQKGMLVPGTNIRFLDGENETLVFYSDLLPGIVFKIPRRWEPFSLIFQEVNMGIVQNILPVKKINIKGIDMFDIEGFIPFVFAEGILIQKMADEVLGTHRKGNDELDIYTEAFDQIDQQLTDSGVNLLEPNEDNVAFVKDGIGKQLKPCLIDFGNIHFIYSKILDIFELLRDSDRPRINKRLHILSYDFDAENIQRKKDFIKKYLSSAESIYLKGTYFSFDRLFTMLPEEIYLISEYISQYEDGLLHQDIISNLVEDLIIIYAHEFESIPDVFDDSRYSDDYESDARNQYEKMKRDNPVLNILSEIKNISSAA